MLNVTISCPMRIDYEIVPISTLELDYFVARVTPEFIHIQSIILQKHSNSQKRSSIS